MRLTKEVVPRIELVTKRKITPSDDLKQQVEDIASGPCTPSACTPNVPCNPNTSCSPYNCMPSLRPCMPECAPAPPCKPTGR